MSSEIAVLIYEAIAVAKDSRTNTAMEIAEAYAEKIANTRHPIPQDVGPGSIALCSLGYLGLVQEFKGGVWHGVSLSEAGRKWTSRSPRVLGRVSAIPFPQDVRAVLEQAREAFYNIRALADTAIPVASRHETSLGHIKHESVAAITALTAVLDGEGK